MGTFSYRNFLIALFLGCSILSLCLLSLSANAQGCGDPCVFYTPTPSGTFAPPLTPGPGTPTAVPMAATMIFPQPNYPIPTSIPVMSFPPVPSPISVNLPTAPTAINPSPLTSTFLLTAPNPISLDVISFDPISPSAIIFETVTPMALPTINTSLSITYSTPLTLGPGSGGITGSVFYTAATGLIGDVSGLVTDVVSYTDWLSTTAANITPTDTFTIANAPEWYAPALPRPVADVGWTFETLQSGIDQGKRYSLAAWSNFFGYVTSLPFQLVKLLYQIAVFLGPLGLFVTWLVVMIPPVLFFRILIFIKNLFISLLNFIIKVLGFFLSIFTELIALVFKIIRLLI